MYNSHMNDTPVAYDLIHAAHLIEERLEQVLAEVGLSGAKFAALSSLVKEEAPVSLRDLASKLSCVRSNVTQLVDRLEAEGFVRRVEDPEDRRGVRAEITRLGRQRQKAGLEVVTRVHAELNKKLAAIDVSQLSDVLRGI